MRPFVRNLLGATALLALMGGTASAADCEVTHWWTSGGEAAAVAEFAKAFDALGGDKWVDGAIGGSGDTARPDHHQPHHGRKPALRDAVQPGQGRRRPDRRRPDADLTDLATKEGWKRLRLSGDRSSTGCTKDGKVYCVPVNLHSAQWMWINRHVYEDAGLTPPTNWDEVVAAAPKLKEKGIMPLSAGAGLAGQHCCPTPSMCRRSAVSNFIKIYKDRDIDARQERSRAEQGLRGDGRGPQARRSGRRSFRSGTTPSASSSPARPAPTSWATGPRASSRWPTMVAGTDYDCLPGLGLTRCSTPAATCSTSRRSDDPAVTAAQLKMASMMISKPVQVAFNLKKGSLPIRQDVDLPPPTTA